MLYFVACTDSEKKDEVEKKLSEATEEDEDGQTGVQRRKARTQ